MVVVVEKEAELPLRVGEVLDADLLDIDILPVVDQVVADKPDSKVFIGRCYICHEGFLGIFEAKLPPPVYPFKPVVGPYPEPELVPVGMVLLLYAWEVDVTNAVVLVKCD